ncbi:MAG: Protein TolB [bacterium]|nr:Protein TolB [bacterium]
MKRTKHPSIWQPLAFSILLLAISPLSAQVGNYFGQNKVPYKKFDWAVFRTAHFDIHYYSEEKQAALDAARMAERGYAYLSAELNHQIKNRIPLFLYASLNDFQQTNIISDLLDQGTRGVTESLKNRVVLPITGSYREFNHVLVHEMVHAFQYDIMQNSPNRSKSFNPPLWFVEGMAEYLSANMDNTTRMWVRDGLLDNKLLTVSQLNSAYDIRVYRLGESLWHYIGETNGKKSVGNIFKSAVNLGNVEPALKKQLNLDFKQLTKAWHEYARKSALPPDSTLPMPEQIAERITHQQGYYHRLNVAPAVSPDGNHIAYIANKKLNEDIYLLSRDAKGKWQETQLIAGGASKRFETLRYFDSAIGWSRDGNQLAFIAKSGRDDALYVMNPHTKKVTQKFVFANLNGLQSPSFSPYGDELVFVGIAGGVSDLYVVDLADGKLKRLTHDRFAELHPQWSPDGKTVVFATDRGKGTDEAKLLFSAYNLALYHLASNQIDMITALPGNVTSPQWSPDGSAIAFISDHQGIPNAYRLQLADKQITPLTALRNGIAGITESTPALSWSANGKVMVFSAFQKTNWQLYRLDLEKLPLPGKPVESTPLASMNHAVDLPKTDSATATAAATTTWLPDLPDPNTLYADYPLAAADSIESRDYSSKFKLDAVAVGGAYDTYYGGVGQAVFLFSDLLGNHNLYLSSAMQIKSPLHSDLGVTYFNQGHRLNYGVQAFQSNLLYTIGANFNSIGYLRNTYRGFNAIAGYPFSRFARIEFFGGLTWVDQDVVVETYNVSSFDRETSNLALYKYAQVGTALVFDNTIYGPLGPTSGSRNRFSVETTMKDFQFTNYFADHRRYINIGHRTVLAWRLMGGASVGRDEQIFSMGGPYTFRGADYDTFFGTKFLLSNLEYRFPLLPFLPANADFLSAAAYYDAVAAWGIDVPGYSKKSFQPFSSTGGFHLKDLNSAVGIGARLNLGYFLLQYDVAWRTDLQNFSRPVKQFSIGTFF